MESHRGQQYIGEKKLTVTLYTYINHHVGTPKQKQTSLKKNQTTPDLDFLSIPRLWGKKCQNV